MNYTLDEIIDLAANVELGDAIDWTGLNIERDRVYQIIASQVYEMYANSAGDPTREAVMVATIVKLVVENFVLNLKLESKY